MKTTLLLKKFTDGLVWNGVLYTIYKILFVAFSFALYQSLPAQDFSLWATVNSTVFIILLWLNCGLKKSIPRFSPAFAKNIQTHHYFINGLLLFQTILLFCVGLPLLYFLVPFFFPQLTFVMPFFMGIFITQGLVTLLELIFHAHFWQKQFNLLQTFFILCEMIVNFLLLSCKVPTDQLIKYTFITKTAAGACIAVASFFMLPALYRDRNYPGTEKVNLLQTAKQFFIHSGAMWASSIIKSLSERNVLFPYLTLMIGISSANFFKITHDAALFFQRVALKTIGVTDTALLAHLEVDHKRSKTFLNSFKKLQKSVFILCGGLWCMAITYLCYTTRNNINSDYIGLFMIIMSSYLLEIVLSPFERILETKQNYTLLCFAYIPYLVIIAASLYFKFATQMTLFPFISLLHCARLISAFLMKRYAQQIYLK